MHQSVTETKLEWDGPTAVVLIYEDYVQTLGALELAEIIAVLKALDVGDEDTVYAN